MFTFCFATFAYYFTLNSSLPSVRCTGILLLFTFLRSIIYDDLLVAHTVASEKKNQFMCHYSYPMLLFFSA